MKMFVRIGVLSAFALASVVVAARGQAAQEQAQKKEPPVYDEAADARAQVAAAVAHAKKDNKRVLIEWGANWCPWCVLLHGTMKSDKDVARKLMYEYEVVRIDVGRLDKNTDLAKELGAEFKAIPFMTVLGADGKALVQQPTEEFETNADGKQGHDPKKLVEFLTKYQAPPLVAADVRTAALTRAKAEKKLVLMHTGAPWCGWCHKLEAWMEQPAVAELLAKDFVDLKIDNDRMTGAKDVIGNECARAQLKEQGFPWIVVLDAEGAQLAHGTPPGGQNIGFPYQDNEIAHFISMLSKVKRNLTDADLTTLRDSLTAVRKADEAKKIQQ